MPNFHPILFKLCAYVNYMLIYKMHREGKFPKTITNLAGLFLELFEPPSYFHNMLTLDLFLPMTGDPQVGKTSILLRYLRNQFSPLYLPTRKVAIGEPGN